MNAKQERQQNILRLIAEQPIARQEELSVALKAIGISTTQSTLSKDIKELGVVKVPDGAGGFRYQAPDAFASAGPLALQGENLLRRELQDFVVSVEAVAQTLVLKTITGHAQGVCEAIDQADWAEVAGTLAGENTIFVLCRSSEACQALEKRIEAHLKTPPINQSASGIGTASASDETPAMVRKDGISVVRSRASQPRDNVLKQN